jgi:hypothetical protein
MSQGPFTGGHCHELGFNNDICGRLLCPGSMNWDDNRCANMNTGLAFLTCKCSIKQGLRDLTIKPQPDDFPSFLYCDGVIHEDDLFKGFLRSDLLVLVSLHSTALLRLTVANMVRDICTYSWAGLLLSLRDRANAQHAEGMPPWLV